MYILNLEDDVCKHHKICTALKNGGLGIVTIARAKNLEDGIELIKTKNQQNQPYDLIITDMWYPEKDGGEEIKSGEKLIQTVKDNGWNIPIILCSSVSYRIPEILGVVHYSENGKWETSMTSLIKNLENNH